MFHEKNVSRETFFCLQTKNENFKRVIRGIKVYLEFL